MFKKDYIIVGIGSFDVHSRDYVYLEYEFRSRNDAQAIEFAGYYMQSLLYLDEYYEMFLYRYNFHLSHGQKTKILIKTLIPDDGYWPAGKAVNYSFLERGDIDFSLYDDDDYEEMGEDPDLPLPPADNLGSPYGNLDLDFNFDEDDEWSI